jgi:putative ABC transport system substrate-binding protein
MTALALGMLASVLSGSAPVVVVESHVAQYRTAARAAEAHLPGATEVEPGDEALGSKLAGASVVVAVGRKALAAARASASADAAVVFCMVLGVTSADLGRASTGVPLESDPRITVARIRQIAPGAKRVGLIYDPAGSALFVERARAAAAEAGLTLVATSVAGSAQAKSTAEGMAGKIDGLWLPPDPRIYSRELSAYLLGFASERKLPLFGFLESFTEAGALASMSPDYADVGDRAGKLAAEVAARPAASRLPVPPLAYAPGDLSINLNTAQALGLEIPASAQASAKRVIR